MGFIIPENPREQVQMLIEKKENIEAELDAQVSILKANNCTLHSSLVDKEGFPRADIDIYLVRAARVRVIELRNDLKANTDDLAKALELVYARSAQNEETPAAEPVSPTVPTSHNTGPQPGLPFAKVNGVAPGSPAAEAGLQREDLITQFGHLSTSTTPSLSIQSLSAVVHENSELSIMILRSDQTLNVKLTPRNGWGGRGMLGCHIVPYAAP